VNAQRGERKEAEARYEQAAAELDDKGARLYAMSARYRLGRLRGGDDGDALAESARQAMREERITVPEKMVRVFAPGVDADPPASDAPTG
jgi:hypothetical protein